MSDNFRYVLTVKDILQSLKSFSDDGVLIDVDLKNGEGFFPKLTSLGLVDLNAFGIDYNLIREENFDIKDVDALLVDISESKTYTREFLPMSKNFKPDIPENALRLGDMKNELSKYDPKTVILKRTYYGGDSDTYISPSYLGHYNNETYPLVSSKGEPITAGLNNNQTATFSIGGKSNYLDAFIYKIVKK